MGLIKSKLRIFSLSLVALLVITSSGLVFGAWYLKRLENTVTEKFEGNLDKQNQGFADRGSKIRAYAGIPLTTANGQVLGAFCALDERPRDWSKRDIDVLGALSVAVMSEIQRRIIAQGLGL